MGSMGHRWGFPGDGGTRLTSRMTRTGLLWMKMEYLEGVVAGLVEAEEEDYCRGVNASSRMLEVERQVESLAGAASGRAPRVPDRGDGRARTGCWTCGQEGHLQARCPQAGSTRARQLSQAAAGSGVGRCARQERAGIHQVGTFPRGGVVCRGCGARNHLSRNCPQVTGQGRPYWGDE